jgi:hypothetical protein
MLVASQAASSAASPTDSGQEVEDLLGLLGGPLELYTSSLLRIVPKEGQKIIPLILNQAQLEVHRQLEDQLSRTKKVRALILKGRQQGMCLAPDTRVLAADLRWVPIAEVAVGDELVATDENIGKGRGAGTRRMRTSKVEKIWRTRRQSFRITFDDGRNVVCSAEHRWLSRKSQPQAEWRSISGAESASKNGLRALNVGDLVRSIVKPWGASTLDDAWFGGMIDGEGSLDFQKRSGVDLAISQRAGAVLSRMIAHCSERNFAHCLVADGERKTKLGKSPVFAVSISNMPDVFRVVGQARPTRFIGARWWEGKRLPDNGWCKIAAIEPMGEMDLIDIQTSTGTFVAEGFVSHNSTYVAARFFRRQHVIPATNVYILSHEQKSTDHLFNMAKRYWRCLPPSVQPIKGRDGADEMSFPLMDCTYSVGTAGAKETGRSKTPQLFHGSEVALWKNADTHLAGVLQGVPNVPGSEIILETTARGVGGTFYNMWIQAKRGIGEYIAIFVPWFWDRGYRLNPPDDWQPAGEWVEYQQLYKLDRQQTFWAYHKNIELGGGGSPEKIFWLFRQEYPGNADEAFQAGGTGGLIKPELVLRARQAQHIAVNELDAKLLGVDVARNVSDGDMTELISRQGRVAGGLVFESMRTDDTMKIVNRIVAHHQEHRFDMIFIDVVGVGAGVYDRLRELGYGARVMGVNFGDEASRPDRYANKRAECWVLYRDWLETPGGVLLPNDDTLQSHSTCVKWEPDAHNRYKLFPKKIIRKEYGFSPDKGDAIAVTFAAPVVRHASQRITRANGYGNANPKLRKRSFMAD